MEPGGRWGDVLAVLDPYDVSVIGGRIPLVGVLVSSLEVPNPFEKLSFGMTDLSNLRRALSLLRRIRPCWGQRQKLRGNLSAIVSQNENSLIILHRSFSQMALSTTPTQTAIQSCFGHKGRRRRFRFGERLIPHIWRLLTIYRHCYPI